MYHTLEFWNLARNAIIKPHSSNGGKIKYSSALYKRFFSTTRAPGVEYDYLKKYFKSGRVFRENPNIYQTKSKVLFIYFFS